MNSLNSKLIFVTGASRSGTTMLSRIFGRHPEILSLNELHVFGDLIKPDHMLESLTPSQQAELARKIIQRQTFGIFHAQKELEDDTILSKVVAQLGEKKNTASEVFRICIDTLVQDAGKVIGCEQTPRNIFYSQQLLKAYPEAHIVHIIRDPRSVLASQKGKWRRKFLGGDTIPWLEVIRMWCNYHPITLSKLWVRANQKAIEMNSENRFHLIKFEALLAAPESAVASLCDDIGIGFEKEMLNIRHIGSSHKGNTNEAQGISSTTNNSWKDELSLAEVRVSQNICGSTMQYYDYHNDDIKSASFLSTALVWLRFPAHLLGVTLFNPQRAMIQLTSMFSKSR